MKLKNGFMCQLFIFILLFSHYVVSNSFITPWTVLHQPPLSIEFLWQGYMPFILNSRIKPPSPVSPALEGGFFTNEPPGKPISTGDARGKLFWGKSLKRNFKSRVEI